jgi:hypothetical protein
VTNRENAGALSSRDGTYAIGVILLALLPTYEPVPETTSGLDPGQLCHDWMYDANRVQLLQRPRSCGQQAATYAFYLQW